MKKKSGVVISLVIVLICGAIVSVFMTFGVSKWEVYCRALDALMLEDIGLNDGMKYIAVNVDSLEGINEEDNENVLEYFEKYNVEVINESFDSLREKGMVKDGNAIDGILLSVDKSNTFIAVLTFEQSKFRAGTGAIGGQTTAIGIFGIWIMISTRTSWIS